MKGILLASLMILAIGPGHLIAGSWSMTPRSEKEKIKQTASGRLIVEMPDVTIYRIRESSAFYYIVDDRGKRIGKVKQKSTGNYYVEFY